MSYTEAEYAASASKYSVPVPAVKAVIEVEAAGEGFLPDGRPKILFEAHWFGKLTHYKFSATHPTLSCRSWDEAKQYYVGGEGEWTRLHEAMKLDDDAALQSASWGAGQVMGFNYRDLGFADVESFVVAMGTAAGQMDAMMRYIKFHRLDRYMVNFPERNAVDAFTAGYNGTGQIAVYSPRIIAAYDRAAHGVSIVTKPQFRTLSVGAKGADVRELQEALLSLQLYVGKVDGDFGPRTKAAVILFQDERDLEADGIVGPRTRSALNL